MQTPPPYYSIIGDNFKGEKGEQGSPGIKGDKGDQGPQGNQGPAGIKGDTGDRGLKGDTGYQGIQGIQGEKGDPGDCSIHEATYNHSLLHSNSLDHDGTAQNTAISSKTTLTEVKADSDIADTITKKHANTLDHSNSLDHNGGTQDSAIASKTSLPEVKADTDISSAISLKHSNSLDHSNSSDHSHANKSTLDTYDQSNINLTSAVSLKHANTLDHSNSLDHNHSNKTTLDSVQEALTTALKGNYDSAYSHSIAAHAPSNAQKNSDILKAEIEAKLTGEISSHSHAGGAGLGYSIQGSAGNQATTTDSQTMYWGNTQLAPTTTAGNARIYIPKAGTVKAAYVFAHAATAGTAENWSINIRKNNSADTLIQTLSLSSAQRVWSNTALSLTVALGDYIEIKEVQPAWTTNPANVRRSFILYIE